MKIFLFAFVLFIAANGSGQSLLICDGKRLPEIKASLYLNGYEQKGLINYHQMPGNLTLGLNDPSYKTVGFKLVLPCPSNSVIFDMRVKEYKGNRIKADDPIFRSVKISQLITLDCITVEKNGVKYSVSPLVFEIVDPAAESISP